VADEGLKTHFILATQGACWNNLAQLKEESGLNRYRAKFFTF
jgi:hypothetical protein